MNNRVVKTYRRTPTYLQNGTDADTITTNGDTKENSNNKGKYCCGIRFLIRGTQTMV